MNYTQSLRYLDSFLNFEIIQRSSENRLWNLERMRYLLKVFELPQKDFFPVLIAGTKGKGSTGFFLESILREQGLKVGFYCSPHLIHPRERIRVQGRDVSKRLWTQGLMTIKNQLRKQKIPARLGRLTYFEIMTLLAAIVFQKAGVQIALFEVGMGGRLDATNALGAQLVLMSAIHYDHEAFLGNTLSKIAKEKAAVIHSKAYVVSAQQPAAAMAALRCRCQKVKATLKVASSQGIGPLHLKGDFQIANAALAREGALLLGDRFGFSLKKSSIPRGLRTKQGWPGRFEVFKKEETYLLDVAHNPASTEALERNLRKWRRFKNRVLVFGVSRDKKVKPMLKTLSRYFSEVIIPSVPHPRMMSRSELMNEAKEHFENVYAVPAMTQALDIAKRLVGRDGLIVGTGSFYLAGEMKKVLQNV